jgi:hypothetical protein
MNKEMSYKKKSKQILNYEIMRRYKNGKILLGQNAKHGLCGYDNSDDYNRIILYPKGYYLQHSFCSAIGLGDVWFEDKEYEFRGEY